MKHKLIAILLSLVLASTVSADPLGTWKITMDGPGGEMVNYLTIRKEGHTHFASMANDQGEAEIGEVQVEGDHIEFEFSRVIGAYTMNMSYVCDVDGDSLSGAATTSRGTLPFTGARQ